MSVVRIDNFGGLILTKDPKKGPFWTALKANNCDIRSGSIDVAYSISTADAVNLTGSVGRKTIHNINGSTFLEWSQDVDVVRSPLADNSSARVYYTGDNIPKTTDYSTAIGGAAPYPAVYWTLGIPVPPDIAYIGSSGGTGDVEDRAYIYTHVSPWGEEGPPGIPKSVTSNTVGATVVLEQFGCTTRSYSGTLPFGIAVTAETFVAGPPGYVRFALTTATFFPDIRAGDRILAAMNSTTDQRYKGYLVSHVDAALGYVECAANIWDNVGAPTVIWSQTPLNRYNIVGATANTPSTGKVRVAVHSVDGLRATEKVVITGVSGMTDLNGTFAVDSVNNADPTNPTFDVTLTTAQVYTSGGAARREARHNTSEMLITGITLALGVATVTCEHVANMAAGDNVVIQGVMGAYQANGLRTVTGVNVAAGTFTFALAAMSAYTSGGIVILPKPYSFDNWAVLSLSASGGVYPAPNVITIRTSTNHNLVVDDLVLGYDIGGAVEINNVMRVASIVSGSEFTVKIGCPMTAFTAGGRIVKLRPQYRRRIYRTGTGSTTAEYQLVAEIMGDEGMYTDIIDTGGLGAVLESETWIQPPTDMFGLVAHPHGFLVGASKNILCPSEPYQPHAFPEKYQVPLPSDIVGIGIYGTTIIAFTKDIPINVQGYTPDQLTRGRQDVGEPCTSKRSISSTGLGVLYRGTSGLFLLGYEGSDNATKNYLPASGFTSASDTISAYWGNKICWIDNATQSGYLFDPVREDKGLTEFSVDYAIYDLHVSPIDGQLWASYLDGSQAKRAPLFKIVSNPAKFTYWTQHIQLPKPVSFGALKVEWDWHLQGAAMKDREAMIVRNLRRRAGRAAAIGDHYIGAVSLGGDEYETVYSADTSATVPTERFMKVTVIAEPNITDKTTTVFDDYVVNDNPVRISNGIKSDVWQLKIVGNAKVSAVSLAEDITELGRV